jgi:formate hydrogenlyase subunit 4
VQAAMESMSVLAAMAVMIVLIALSFLGSGFWTRLRAMASARNGNTLLGSTRCSILK